MPRHFMLLLITTLLFLPRSSLSLPSYVAILSLPLHFRLIAHLFHLSFKPASRHRLYVSLLSFLLLGRCRCRLTRLIFTGSLADTSKIQFLQRQPKALPGRKLLGPPVKGRFIWWSRTGTTTVCIIITELDGSI